MKLASFCQSEVAYAAKKVTIKAKENGTSIDKENIEARRKKYELYLLGYINTI